MSENTPLHRRPAITSADHNAGMQRTVGTVRSVSQPSRELARVTLEIPGLRHDPGWLRPNAALRFYLSPEFGEVSRVYTVRSADTEHETIDVDVVLHGEASPMMVWVTTIRPGDTVELVGPRPHSLLPDHPERPVALFLDATAVPALYSILRSAPETLHGVGWVATDDEIAFDELPRVTGLDLRRIPLGSDFAAQLRELEDPASYVVWGAGERDAMKQIRAFFRKECGLSKDEVSVFGYWKRGASNTDIDANRLKHYEAVLASGGTVGDLDDLDLAI